MTLRKSNKDYGKREHVNENFIEMIVELYQYRWALTVLWVLIVVSIWKG